MPFYAQLNTSDDVVAATQTHSEIVADDMILIESLDTSLLGKHYNRETEAFETPTSPVRLGVLAHDCWAIAADDNEIVTLTYTADEAVCFVVNDEIHIVEPVDQVATLEITADAVGPIRIEVRGQSLVLAATEVTP